MGREGDRTGRVRRREWSECTSEGGGSMVVSVNIGV